MSDDSVYNVLFLCTGNSCRSIMAEAYMNFAGMGRFRAVSAGSDPAGKVNPMALETLRVAKIPAPDARSKDWAEFAADRSGPLKLDFTFTLCDQAAGEVCPVWPGQPITAHWPFPDPAKFDGTDVEQRAFFLDVLRQIRTRIDIFMNLPIAGLDKLPLQEKLDELGRQNETA